MQIDNIILDKIMNKLKSIIFLIFINWTGINLNSQNTVCYINEIKNGNTSVLFKINNKLIYCDFGNFINNWYHEIIMENEDSIYSNSCFENFIKYSAIKKDKFNIKVEPMFGPLIIYCYSGDTLTDSINTGSIEEFSISKGLFTKIQIVNKYYYGQIELNDSIEYIDSIFLNEASFYKSSNSFAHSSLNLKKITMIYIMNILNTNLLK